jgi:hypothetical protein
MIISVNSPAGDDKMKQWILYNFMEALIVIWNNHLVNQVILVLAKKWFSTRLRNIHKIKKELSVVENVPIEINGSLVSNYH